VVEGIIKRLVSDRGFGFLERLDGKPDVFFHASNTGGMFEALLVGDTVRLDEGEDARSGRPTAINVELVRPAALAACEAFLDGRSA